MLPFIYKALSEDSAWEASEPHFPHRLTTNKPHHQNSRWWSEQRGLQIAHDIVEANWNHFVHSLLSFSFLSFRLSHAQTCIIRVQGSSKLSQDGMTLFPSNSNHNNLIFSQHTHTYTSSSNAEARGMRMALFTLTHTTSTSLSFFLTTH